jgi:hypothetical protein
MLDALRSGGIDAAGEDVKQTPNSGELAAP